MYLFDYSTYQYILAHHGSFTLMSYAIALMDCCQVEHGDKGRVVNPSLVGQIKITVRQCKTLYLILVVSHRCSQPEHGNVG